MGSNLSFPTLLDSSCPRVLVLGGGYGGALVAKQFDETGKFNVLLIDRKNYYLHNIAAVRATAQKDYSSDVLIPYDKLMKNGSFLQAEIEEVRSDGVLLRGYSSPISFDYLVIALGSSYNFPGKSPVISRNSALLEYNSFYETLCKSQQITVVGGGPAGVEIAAEIACAFSFESSHNKKQIRLIHAQNALLSDKKLKMEMRTQLLKQLQQFNIEVLLNERVVLTDEQQVQLKQENVIRSKTSDCNFVLRTESGHEYKQDLAIICTGAKVANGPLLKHFSEFLNEEGRLKINDYLQIQNYKNIFALGDIAGTQTKQAYFAHMQVPIIVSNISTLAFNKNKSDSINLSIYKPMEKPAALISLGPKSGIGQYGDSLFGSWMVWLIKSKDLFTHKNWHVLNNTSNRTKIKQNDRIWIEKQTQNNQQKNERKQEEEKQTENEAANENEIANNDIKNESDVDIRVKNLQTFLQTETDKATAVKWLQKGI